MKKDQLETISCPFCGYEYLPAEIFVPGAFFGHPTDIERNSHGQILTFQNATTNYDEEYVCDHCSKKFKIHANVKYKAFSDPKDEFDTEYVSPLHETKLTLFED